MNLTYDSGFKIVFGTEGKSERLLMTLLNRVLGMKIVSVKYLPTERLGLTEEESRSFFDVYCKDSGRVWDYYFAPVYQVSFLNFPNTIVEPKEDGGNPYISHYVYRSKDTGRELGDDTNMIFIDLQKFRKDFDKCEDIMNRNDIENIICERYEDGFAEGREEGREEGRLKTIWQLIESGCRDALSASI